MNSMFYDGTSPYSCYLSGQFYHVVYNVSTMTFYHVTTRTFCLDLNKLTQSVMIDCQEREKVTNYVF